MMVQVLEADERRVRRSSLQTGCRERSPRTAERHSQLVFMMESAVIDGCSLRDLQRTFMEVPPLPPHHPPPRCGAQLDSCSQQYDS